VLEAVPARRELKVMQESKDQQVHRAHKVALVQQDQQVLAVYRVQQVPKEPKVCQAQADLKVLPVR
jgi:hypothetical protein